jgi:hypothetical protein
LLAIPEEAPLPEEPPEPEPEPQPQRVVAEDPYEDIDLASAGTPDTGAPDMNIDMSGPEF